MGDDYVLPIEQTRVTQSQAKVKEILAQTDIKAQEIISAAENKSQIVVQTANTEAERIIDDARKKGEQEYESVKSQAYNEGFQKGQEDGLEKFKQDAFFFRLINIFLLFKARAIFSVKFDLGILLLFLGNTFFESD